jgi:hypothetical protein
MPLEYPPAFCIKDFLRNHPWWHGFLVAIPVIAVPVLAYFELRHSSEANVLRSEANASRADANRLKERANALQEQIGIVSAERDAERNKALQAIAANTPKPLTQAERNAATLRKYLNARAFVTEEEGYWGTQPEIVDVSDSNIVTLFRPKDSSWSQAWFVQVHCNFLEISEFPQGDCPVRIKVIKRYGDAVQLGEITKWEDRLKPTATPTFPKGDAVHYANYGKPGSSETRRLSIYASKDGANVFLLESSTAEPVIADNKDISKRFRAMEIEYLADGFTRSGSGTSSSPHPLFVT